MKTKLLTLALAVLTIGLLGSCKKDNGPETPKLPEGALSGVFSVSADKKVYFSKGNLTYNVTDTKWAFYENQYGCATSFDANLISLFTWGYDAAKSIVPDGKEYVGGHTTDGETFSKSEDWGYVFGGESSVWRTLSKDEWMYLLNERIVNDVDGDGKGTSYSLNITFRGKMGIILYPDNYHGAVISGTVNTLPEGVVFLPAAGSRDGSSVSNVGNYGYYWSSSAIGSDFAYIVVFDSRNVKPDNFDYRRSGFSVRLVTDVK